MTSIDITSFGYEHQPAHAAPEADLVFDARRSLRDPARMRDGALLDHDGRHPAVRDIVMSTLGARETVDALTHFARTWPRPRLVIAIGCVGGKHRSVTLAEELARELAADGTDVRLAHRHAHLDRILR